MHTKRIIVSNELRSYGEAISVALRMLCPDADVTEVEHRYLIREVRRVRPHLVVCSRANNVVRAQVPSWVELYPDCGTSSEVCIEGERSKVEDLKLSDLLAIVRETERVFSPN